MQSKELTPPEATTTDLRNESVASQEISVPIAKVEDTRQISENESDSRIFNRRTLLILLAALGVALFFMVKIFIVPVILALCFTTLFYPLYSFFLKITKRNKAISSLICCLILFFGLLIPAYLLTHSLAAELISLYGSAEPQIKELIQRSDQSPLAKLFQHPLLKSIHAINIDWQSVLVTAIKKAGYYGTIILNKTSSELFSLFITVAIMFFTMFYLFIDGEKFISRIRFLSPLKDTYEDLLFKRFLLISRATIRGTIIIGLAQGILGGLTFLIFGVKSWLLWAFVMLMFSLIPFTGAWMVMLPAAVIQLIYGHYWKAAGIAFMSIVVVSSIDNILRPRLVGNEAKMHDLLVLFSTLGGIAIYGIMGFIVGPVIAALFIAVLDMYGMEYRDVLKSNNQS